MSYGGIQQSQIKDSVDYVYRSDKSLFQKFRGIFLEAKPSQGFGSIVTSSMIADNVEISFSFVKKADLLEWTITTRIYYLDYVEVKFGQGYYISLKALSHYGPETMQTSPQSSKSSLKITIHQVDNAYKLLLIKALPANMTMSREKISRVTIFTFEKTMREGERFNDLALDFNIVSPLYIDAATFATIQYLTLSAITAILGVVVVIFRKRRIRRRRIREAIISR